MNPNTQLSILPSVQAFLYGNNAAINENDTVINGYCAQFREIITKLVILHNMVDHEEEGKEILDEVLSFCAYLYEDLDTMRRETVEYLK